MFTEFMDSKKSHKIYVTHVVVGTARSRRRTDGVTCGRHVTLKLYFSVVFVE